MLVELVATDSPMFSPIPSTCAPRAHAVRVSFEKYRSLPPSYLEDEPEGEEEWLGEVKAEPASSSHSRGRRRSKGVSAGTPTKHDPVLCGRRNARNMERVSEELW